MCCFAVLFLVNLLGGCSSESSSADRRRQRFTYEEKLSTPYNQIELKKSMTLDALPKIKRWQNELGPQFGGTELLSHGESVVAAVGQSKDGYKTWFNLVAFHEYRLNVMRKYFFVVDEKTTSLRAGYDSGLRFDCEMVLEEEVLDRSYASENTRRVVILNYVFESLRKDIDALGAGIDTPGQSNKMLSVCGMLINQLFKMIILELDSSPVLVMKLSEAEGIEFDHINFDKGRVRMMVEDDTVALEIRLGAFRNTLQDY